MEIKIVETDKKNYLDLLLLADEQESMIDRYLDRGSLFVLFDDGAKSICVVTDEGDGSFEIQNLATHEEHQGKGYGRRLVNHVCKYYRGAGRAMYVGTGDVPQAVSFYENSGFVFSYRVENFFVEHYPDPMFENGIQLVDKVYFRRGL